METNELETSQEEQSQPEQSIFDNVADAILDGKLPEAKEDLSAEETTETKAEAQTETKTETERPVFRVKVDGEELEVDQDELIKGYQINKHLTQKGQKLAEDEKRLAAYQGLIKHFDNPEFMKHAFSYFDQQKDKEPEQPPDDPIDRIKWDAKQEALQALQPELEKQSRAYQSLEHQQQVGRVLGQLQARDGQDFQVVYSNLKGYVEKNYPPNVAAKLLQEADADQGVFVDIYETAMKDFRAFKESKAKPPAKQQTKQEIAPVLESAGSDTGETEAMASKKKVKKLKAEALRTGDPAALEKWFMESGLVDSLV